MLDQVSEKTAILLQLEKTATDQLSDIKREEMQWLQAFLVFSTAVIAWSMQKFILPDQQNSALTESVKLVIQGVYNGDVRKYTLVSSVVMSFSFFSATIFGIHFMKMRHSYYAVARRLVAIQTQLDLYKIPDNVHFAMLANTGKVVDRKTWLENTKPFSSFFMRMVYVFGANQIVIFAFFIISSTVEPSLFGFVIFSVINAGVAASIYVYDYFALRVRKAQPGQNSPSSGTDSLDDCRSRDSVGKSQGNDLPAI